MISRQKLTDELNSDSEHGEWKIQLSMHNNFISTKHFEETRTVYSANAPVEIFMGADTDDAVDRLFDTLLERFQQAIEISNDNGSAFTHRRIALLHYCFQKIDIRRAESYIKSADWLLNKGATVKSKKWNKKDNKCFQFAITSALNHKKIEKNICNT